MKYSAYETVIVETFREYGAQTNTTIRVRPLPGQGYSADIRVECSREMRNSHPIGTIFEVRAKLTDREGGPDFLYSNFNWPYKVVTQEEARKIIGHETS